MPTRAGVTCSPNTAWGAGSRSAPASIIAWAPDGSPGIPSSFGWNRKTTVPGSRSLRPASTFATPSSIAVCMSWPQACITPTSCPLYVARTVDLNGRSTCSVTGSASMSARSATTGPGRAPRRTPTTPVRPTPVRTSRPSRVSSAATRAAVRVSWKPSSGCWWMSRRHWTTCGNTAATARSISGANDCPISGDTEAAVRISDNVRIRALTGLSPSLEIGGLQNGCETDSCEWS